MSEKSNILKGFNNHLFDFLDDIAAILPEPENEEILKTKVFFDTIKKANPTVLIKCWYKFVYVPYRNIIDNGDITFFFEKDYQNDVSNLAKSEDIVKGINKIREPIKNMSEENQQHSMKYIQNLSKLSEIYHG